MKTLPDYPCHVGGVLLIGINPSPVSVAAGHYYHGRHGKRLWMRMEALGLLVNASQGREDEAFTAAGNGLTDLVKRPTASAIELRAQELAEGAILLRKKVEAWKPGLILFAYRPPAVYLLKGSIVKPGKCEDFASTRTFLLTSPYSKAKDSKRVNEELVSLLQSCGNFGYLAQTSCADVLSSNEGTRGLERRVLARTQRVTAKDIENGQIRLPRNAKWLFPRRPSTLLVRLRGNIVDARYNPRIGPDKERSAVLRVGKIALKSMEGGPVLSITREDSGTICLEEP